VINKTPPLVVALDYPHRDPALALARRLVGRVAFVKVGLQLFVAEGPPVVADLLEMGHEVWVDLKLHDIPNTVAGAVTAAARTGARLLTVHAGGGQAMLSAAVAAAAPHELRLLGVTVLTSLDQGALVETGVAGHLIDQVIRLAALAHLAGVHGCVTSPREAARLRAAHPEPFLIVTPGVRPTWEAGSGDQARVATPRQAVLAGADLVVVGRPITAAGDPTGAAERIGEELAMALGERGRPRPFGEALRDDWKR
jgi:orotidine-5'-phosphate decarboxylase